MSAADPVAGTVSFTYSAGGQRTMKEGTDGSVTGYLYDAKRLLHETDDVGDISNTYAAGTAEEFGDLLGEGEGVVHQYDAQANTHALLDATGSIETKYKYQAFGQVAAVVSWGGQNQPVWGG